VSIDNNVESLYIYNNINYLGKEKRVDTRKKTKWEKPKVFRIGALDNGLGHCVPGSSAEALSCHNGEQTAGTGIGHLCQAGGIAGPTVLDCITGASPGPTPTGSKNF